jgi:hypothetical protein
VKFAGVDQTEFFEHRLKQFQLRAGDAKCMRRVLCA